MGCLLGVDHIPGIMTIFGVTTMLVAIHLINRGASIKQRDKQFYLKQMELQMKEFDNRDESELVEEIQHLQGHLDNILYFGDGNNPNST